MNTNYENDDWVENFITFDGNAGKYIAWDETQANELGRFFSYSEAKEAVLKYTKTLNKKESEMDFQVGDKVVCLLNGDGVVEQIRGEELIYPIVVKFDDSIVATYTKNGRLEYNNRYRSLFHEGTKINITPAEPKRYLWANIYFSENDGPLIGPPHPTVQKAKDSVSYFSAEFYVDTIQLKPKGK